LLEIFDQLIHYRHETFPEDDARRLLVQREWNTTCITATNAGDVWAID